MEMLRISRRQSQEGMGGTLPFCHWDKHIKWSASMLKTNKKGEHYWNHKGTQTGSLMCEH